MKIIKFITSKTQLPESSVKNTIQLLNDACTIPFISRYRKEATGNLDEVQIGAIVQFISRVLISFKFDEKPKWIEALFGGVAITAIIYFILVKG